MRCAIYTRKSSEEGLEQDFNSLDAQRAASEAYVLSQAGEGWNVVSEHYDDGGFSGGTMERPGLKRLLADIEAGEIDAVVVYKIDRLTRSLTDFARIVEIFDEAGCSFVSVTQSFNTTSSMGRLILNVLLSFAQFEREVTGERIRDKIAASKARGMWMGGLPPLGYDIPQDESRTLRVNEDEARRVRYIFSRYLALGSVYTLQRELEAEGITSKRHVTQKGKVLGGKNFSHGALFHLLRNRIYLGQIMHKKLAHDGKHEAIVEQSLFDNVQQQLDANSRRHLANRKLSVAKSLLTGKLFDQAGEAMSPAFTRGRSGKLYRYYVSGSLQRGQKPVDDEHMRRLPAARFEALIKDIVDRWSPRKDRPFDVLKEILLTSRGMLITLTGDRSFESAFALQEGEQMVTANERVTVIEVKLAMPLRGGRRHIVPGSGRQPERDHTLITALRRAHTLVVNERGMPLATRVSRSPYERRIQRLAFLAPDIQRAIIDGRQPLGLNLERLVKTTLPISWKEQHQMLGFEAD